MASKYIVVTAAAFLAAVPCRTAAAEEPALSGITVSGNASVPEAEILGAIDAVGEKWTSETAAFAKAAVLSLYQGAGFMDASADVSELKAGASVQIAIGIREGRRYTFGITDFYGLEKLRPNTILKELAYRKGDPYSQDKLILSQSRLFATEWFDSVRTGISSSPASGTVNVSMTVREKPLKWIKGGVGYGSEEKERLSLGFKHNSFLGRGYILELNALLSRIWLEYALDFTDRHFLNTRTEMRISDVWRRELRSGYDQESLRNTVSFGRALARNLSGSVQYRMQRTLIYDVDAGLADIAPSLSLLNSAGVSLNRDTTDEFFYPSKGLRSEFQLERSGGIWGGDINLYKASLKNNIYRTVLPGITGLLSLRGAFVAQTGRTREVPIYERLFTGGANSIRGYAERDVGPSDADGNPTGGKVLLGGSTELHFPVYRKLRSVVFLDGGQVSGRLAGAAPREWRYGAGAGLRYRTPVGPVRADFGYKLNPHKPVDTDRWRVHLSIGEAF